MRFLQKFVTLLTASSFLILKLLSVMDNYFSTLSRRHLMVMWDFLLWSSILRKYSSVESFTISAPGNLSYSGSEIWTSRFLFLSTTTIGIERCCRRRDRGRRRRARWTRGRRRRARWTIGTEQRAINIIRASQRPYRVRCKVGFARTTVWDLRIEVVSIGGNHPPY